MTMIIRAVVFCLIILGAVFVANNVRAEEEYKGFYGNGHEQWHDVYRQLHNQNDSDCCNDNHCRPTQAKFKNGSWYAMVNGYWKKIDASKFVKEYAYSWSETPHVCASETGLFIYCFVRPKPQG